MIQESESFCTARPRFTLLVCKVSLVFTGPRYLQPKPRALCGKNIPKEHVAATRVNS